MLNIVKMYRGRISRKHFLLSFLLLFFIALLLTFLLSMISYNNPVATFLQMVIDYAWLYLYFGLVNRRIHDIGTGGPINILLVPLAAATGIGFIFLVLKKGDQVKNKFGPIPSHLDYLKLLFAN